MYKLAASIILLIISFCENRVIHSDQTDVHDTKKDYSKPSLFIEHLLYFCYYNSELGNNEPIKFKFDNESVILDYWINGLPLKLITHGWLAKSTNNEGVFAIKTAYVKTGGYNVITLDWSRISENIFYPIPVIATKSVGCALANFLDRLIRITGLNPIDIHLLGHSLGAQVVGTAGRHLESGKIGRITGMDPACPGYETFPVLQMDHLNQEDALFVDVIHTTAGTLGYYSSMGHANFFPNSGKDPQPGCKYLINSLFCSHARAHKLYTDSVYHRNSMFGLECSSWSSFKKHKCVNNTIVPMGHDAIS